MLGQLQHLDQVDKLFHRNGIIINPQCGKQCFCFLFLDAPLKIHRILQLPLYGCYEGAFIRSHSVGTMLLSNVTEDTLWSRSVPNLSGKLKRGSLRYGEAVELADALGYDIVWQKREKYTKCVARYANQSYNMEKQRGAAICRIFLVASAILKC